MIPRRKRESFSRSESMAVASTRAVYRDALKRVSDRVLQRAYERAINAGRQDLANFMITEANDRIEARRLAALPAPSGAALTHVFMKALDREFLNRYCDERRDYHRVARAKARQRQRGMLNPGLGGEGVSL